ncbi:hypothetical protein ACVRZD_07550 [Streptococcus hongkongensis]|nr:hypothetical protein NC01_09880 [Streptococcus uberis]
MLNKEDENNKSKKRKYLLFLLLLALIPAFVGGAYAYWAGNISDPVQVTKNPTVNIGKANDVTTTLNVSDSTNGTKTLVPAGKSNFSVGGADANTELFEQTINVTWVDSSKTVSASDQVNGNLAITATPKISGADSYNSLVNVKVEPTSATIKLNNTTAIPVKVTVTLNEPSDKVAYDAIINKQIIVDLTFKVTKQ